MQGRIKLFAFAVSLLMGAPAFAMNSVTIMADSAVSIPIAEIARNYSRDNQLVVNTSFTTQNAQEMQITEGGAADILITPKEGWIDQLKTQGLIDIYSQASVARNRLALVGPVDSPLQVKLSQAFPTAALINQMGGEQDFVVGNPETLVVGIYGKEALRNLGVAGDLEPYTLYIKQLDQMFEMVIKQHAYGIFLYSSIMGREGLRVLDVLPENSHHPIHYYAVVIAGDNMDEARKFLEYLKSADAKKVFRDNGLVTD